MTVLEIIHTHMERYSEELQRKLGELSRAYYETPDRPAQDQAVIDVLRHQVYVLEARIDTLRDLEKEVSA